MAQESLLEKGQLHAAPGVVYSKVVNRNTLLVNLHILMCKVFSLSQDEGANFRTHCSGKSKLTLSLLMVRPQLLAVKIESEFGGIVVLASSFLSLLSFQLQRENNRKTAFVHFIL